MKNTPVAPPEGLDEFLATPTEMAMPMEAQRLPAEASEPPPGLDEFIAPELKEEKYGTIGQQVATAAEGAASAATFGLSTGVERALGVPAEDIRSRAETNPGAHMVGEVAGLVGTTILGTGAGAALEAAGAGAAKAIGLGAPATALSKIGSAATKAAVENGLFQAGDEVSKMLASDPNQTISTAAANVGLAGLLGGAIGGGLGTVSPLWSATAGPKVETFLKRLSDKAGGIEGVMPDALKKAIDDSGIEMAPEIKAALSGDAELMSMAKTLEQSDTTAAGKSYQESLKAFNESKDNALAGAFGRKLDDISGDVSKYEAGKGVGETLSKEFSERVGPLSERYQKFNERFKSVELDPTVGERAGIFEKERIKAINDLGKAQRELTRALKESSPESAIEAQGKLQDVQSRLKAIETEMKTPGTTDKISQDIQNLVQKEGWYASPSSDIMREVQRIQAELPNLKTLNDLTNYIKAVGDNMQSDFTKGQLVRAGGMIKGILRDAESSLIERAVGEESPMLLTEYQLTRQAWRKAAELHDDLNSRLHIKGSTSGYAKALKEAATGDGETILRRLSGKNDADLLRLLQDHFPKTAEALKAAHINELLGTAVDKAKPGSKINATHLINSINKMEPELRNFVVPAQTQGKVAAVERLTDQLKLLPHNFSNTARTVDRLLEWVPASGAAMVGMVLGHNPILAGGMGILAKYLGKDVPDAMRLGLLKFMGEAKPVNGTAFKAMVDTIHAVAKGEKAMNSGIKSVFKAGRQVMPQAVLPKESDRKKLDKFLKQAQLDPTILTKVGGDMGHYMPSGSGAAAQIAANAVNYLNARRPNETPASPLDSKAPVSPEAQAKFNRLLDIANTPLSVLNGVKSGRLTPEEVGAVKNLFPGLYERLTMKLMDEMNTHISKGEAVPYATRIGLSMFLGQPLDSTMTPTAIMMNQPQPAPQPNPAPGKPPSASSMKGLSKLPTSYMTPGQARAQEKSMGK